MGDILPMTFGREIGLMLDPDVGILLLFPIEPVPACAVSLGAGKGMKILQGSPIRYPSQDVTPVLLRGDESRGLAEIFLSFDLVSETLVSKFSCQAVK